jgi:hypothetical protein
MATNTLPQNPRNELEQLLQQWESRWRLKRLVLYLPRVLLLAFGLGILVALVVGILRLVPASVMLMLVIGLSSATMIALSIFFGFFSRTGIERARKFDALFGLQERLATTFELLDGRIKTVEELADLQLHDTLHKAQDIDPKKLIRLEWRKWEWFGAMLAGLLLVLILGLMFLLNSVAGGMGADTQLAIEAAADTTGETIELIGTDTTLTDEDRESLIDSAEATLAELQNPETSAEDAFAAMSELESDLTAQAQEIREDIDNSQAGLSSASASLGSSDPDASQLGQQLGDYSQSLSSMSAEEQQALAQDLQEAADAVREENPELAESLEEAAEAIENGNHAGAESALQTAGQQAEAASQANGEASESAEQMEDLAAEAEQSARDIATSEFNENAQAEGEIDPNGTIEEELGMEEPNIAGAEGEDGGGGNGEDPSTGQSGDLVESDDPGARPADTSGQSEGEGLEGEGSGEESNTGSGAGDGESPQTNEVQGGAPQSEVSNNNQADGLGESEYEEVYAPIQDTPNQGEEDVALDTEEGGQPAVEGNFQENPAGASNVPYNEVFGDYSDEANAALESGYVPLGVRDIVRDYFTSIEPTGNTSDSQP